MSRSKWKKPHQDLQVIKLAKFPSNTLHSTGNLEEKVIANHAKGNPNDEDISLAIYSRSSTISKFFVDKLIKIYTGKELKKVYISSNHLGYKFGEFAPTRKKPSPPKKKSSEQKKKKNKNK
jgi:small subunit ribosomal protein S19